MFRAFRPQHGTVEELSESYLIACHKVTRHALEETVIKLIQGKLPDLSKKWAPGPAELSAAVRAEMAFVEKQVALAAERIQIEDNRPVAVAPLLFVDRAKQARQRMVDEGRKLVFECGSHDQWLSKRRDLPSGGIYLAILGEAYGPPGSLHTTIVDEQFIREQMFEDVEF